MGFAQNEILYVYLPPYDLKFTCELSKQWILLLPSILNCGLSSFLPESSEKLRKEGIGKDLVYLPQSNRYACIIIIFVFFSLEHLSL